MYKFLAPGEEFSTPVTIGGLVFEFCYSPIYNRDSEVTSVIGVALDATGKIKAQKELDKYRREMEKKTWLAEVGTMGSTIAQQLDEPLVVTRLLLQRVLADMSGTSPGDTVVIAHRTGVVRIRGKYTADSELKLSGNVGRDR